MAEASGIVGVYQFGNCECVMGVRPSVFFARALGVTEQVTKRRASSEARCVESEKRFLDRLLPKN